MTRPGTSAAVFGLALLLCACAPSLKVSGGPLGPGFDPKGGIVLPSETSAVEALVLERLETAGMVQRGQGYVVTASYTERPIRARAFVPAATEAAEPDWLIPKQRRALWPVSKQSVYTLVLSLAEPTTGREVYRVSASRHGAPGKGDLLAPALADAAVAQVVQASRPAFEGPTP
jgi:hypothetical protein